MFGPALTGSIQPSAQTVLPSPARTWPRARRCAKSNCKIALYSAWNFPPFHAFGNEIDWARLDAGEKKAKGLVFSRGLVRSEWEKARKNMLSAVHNNFTPAAIAC